MYYAINYHTKSRFSFPTRPSQASPIIDIYDMAPQIKKYPSLFDKAYDNGKTCAVIISFQPLIYTTATVSLPQMTTINY